MVLAILQARFSSSRLPGKVLADLCGEPMLVRQIERVQKCKKIDQLVLAISDNSADDTLVDCGSQMNIPVIRGSQNDVLTRFIGVLERWPAKIVVRLTGDCPLIDFEVIDTCISRFLESEPPVDYLSNTLDPTFPDGLDVEVVMSQALQTAHLEANLNSEREHVTPYIYKNSNRFRLENYSHTTNLSHLRWTVDESEDLEFVRQIYGELYPVKPEFGMKDILDLLAKKPELIRINSEIIRNERYPRSLYEDIAGKNN